MLENETKNTTDIMNDTSVGINQKFDSLRDLLLSLKKYFIDWGIGDFWSGVLVNLVGAIMLLLICWFSYLLARRVVLRVLRFLLVILCKPV